MKRNVELEASIVAKYTAVSPVLDERSRRRWAAAESLSIGYGGDALVSSATGLAWETIRKGRREISQGEAPTDRVRRPGAGRPRLEQSQPGLLAALEGLVDPLTRGDPTSPLRWTCKSRAKLEGLGLNARVYSLISIFCREYIGPGLKKWSPRFFGDGALNLDLFAKRRSEIWVLVKDDIGVFRKGGQREVVTQQDVVVINVANRDATQMDTQNPHRLLRIVDEDALTNLSGHYIRLPGWAFDAYGDLVLDCDTRGVVWTGNRVTFVASDGVSAQFQYDIRLDEIVAVEIGGVMRAQGAFELKRPPQLLFGGLYLPIPMELTRFLVPSGSEEICLDLHCEWVDMRTRQLWEAKVAN